MEHRLQSMTWESTYAAITHVSVGIIIKVKISLHLTKVLFRLLRCFWIWLLAADLGADPGSGAKRMVSLSCIEKIVHFLWGDGWHPGPRQIKENEQSLWLHFKHKQNKEGFLLNPEIERYESKYYPSLLIRIFQKRISDLIP